MDEQELESMLKSFGQVISTRILRDANGTSRGVGFARLDMKQYFMVVCNDSNPTKCPIRTNSAPKEGLHLTLTVFQNGVHGEVRGHNSAFQRQIHKDPPRSAWCVECYFSIIGTWYCCCWCQSSVFLFRAVTIELTLFFWSVSQCPQSPYYVSLPTGVRRRGRTRGSTSTMEGPGLEMEIRWDFKTMILKGNFLCSYVVVSSWKLKQKHPSQSLLLDCFYYRLHWCLHDLTVYESFVLFSQGGMTLAYDPTALQNGWVVCMDWLKTVPTLQENKSRTRAVVKCCPLLGIAGTQKCC